MNFDRPYFGRGDFLLDRMILFACRITPFTERRAHAMLHFRCLVELLR